MDEVYTLKNFLELTDGLKRFVETYEIKTTSSAIMFFFKYNSREYGIWFAHEWMEIGVKTPDGGIINHKECNYNEKGKYLGESDYNLKLKIEYGTHNFNYESLLLKLETCTKNWEVRKHP